MDILVVVAHPDDEVLGMGGTLAKWRQHNVKVIYLSAREGFKFTAQSVAAELGFSFNILPYEDQRLDRYDLNTLTQHIEQKAGKPDAIYTHSPTDCNMDHRVTFHAVRPLARFVKEFVTFEVPSSTEWGDGFIPNMYEDITGYVDKKLILMEVSYGDEMRSFPHPRSVEALRARMMMRGSEANVVAAEAFHIERMVR